MDKENILEVTNLTKKFAVAGGDLTILEELSLVVKKGEKVAIFGPSGSGKSTLLSILGLLDTPTSGQVIIAGQNVGDLSESKQAKFRNQNIGFIFQSFELISPFSVRENISAPLEIGQVKVEPSKVEVLIEKLGLKERSDVLPYTLSGGEKQRVAIGRALIQEPALILADEPTGSLDRTTGEKVLSLLLEAVNERQTTLIIITHDENVAARMDRVFELKNKTLHERV